MKSLFLAGYCFPERKALLFHVPTNLCAYGESINGTVKTSKFRDTEASPAKVGFKSFVEEICDNDDQACIDRNLDAFFIFWKGEQRLLKRLRSPNKYSIEESREFSPADIADTISIWRQGLLEHIYKRYKDKPEHWVLQDFNCFHCTDLNFLKYQ